MAKNNLSVLFWLYKSRTNKQGEAPLYLRITYGNTRKNISTGFSLAPLRWDLDRSAVKGTKEDAVQINKYLSQTRARITELFNDMLKDEDVNLDVLTDRLLNKNNNNRTLVELVKFHNDDFSSKVGIDYSKSTLEKYEILFAKIKLFIQAKYKKVDIRLKDLSLVFISDFEFYLKSTDKNEHNTAIKYIKNLKKIMNFGKLHGWFENNPFEHYKASYKDVDRVYLTQQELSILQQKTFKLKRLNIVRDIFLFQCYTGLAYADMAKLTLRNIMPGIDGNKWIITRRKKTDVRAAIPLLPFAEELISKYNQSPNGEDNSLFDFYSIQKFNAYLHEIAELCSINKNLTSHVGRRTFATTIALANGVGLETISKILGHTNTKITAQYAVVSDHKIGKDMNELRKKLSRD